MFYASLILLLTLLRHHSNANNTYVRGSFYIREGIVFPDEQSYFNMTVSSECTCMKLCMEDERCQNYCWNRYTDHAKCRLSSLNRWNLTTTSCNECGMGYGITSSGFLGEDSFLYFSINTVMNFTEAARQCESQNGFHMGVYKTLIQYNILKSAYNKYRKEIWVDMDSLANSPNAYAVWADETPFNETEIFKMNLTSLSSDEAQNPPTAKFRYNGALFLDKSKSLGSFFALCQLDPSTL